MSLVDVKKEFGQKGIHLDLSLESRSKNFAGGSNILIPRGSTLRGRYNAETRAGETRIIVSWGDLILPDGPTKRLASGVRGDNALASTLWPNDPASLNRESQVTVLVMNEVALAN
jgi:hypothetical protein